MDRRYWLKQMFHSPEKGLRLRIFHAIDCLMSAMGIKP